MSDAGRGPGMASSLPLTPILSDLQPYLGLDVLADQGNRFKLKKEGIIGRKQGALDEQ